MAQAMAQGDDSKQRQENEAEEGVDLSIPPSSGVVEDTIVGINRVLSVLATPLEILLIFLWELLPLRVRNVVIVTSFHGIVALYRLLCACCSQDSDLSAEAQALCGLMRMGTYVPVNLRRVRFGLESLSYAYPPPEGVAIVKVTFSKGGIGYWAATGPSGSVDLGEEKDGGGKSRKPVLIWFYGGAFVGGSAKGNVGAAAAIGLRVGCDVLCVHTRRAPEFTIQDMRADALDAYDWILERRGPDEVAVLGISSGGGIALLMLQELLKKRKHLLPAGAALLGPWIEYTQITDSIRSNTIHDLVVNQRVYEFIHPLIPAICGGQAHRKEVSAYFGPVEGMCPIHISYSLKEVCVDENTHLAKRLRKAGVELQVYTHPTLMHAFQLFFKFLPESQDCMDNIVEFLRAKLKIS